MSEPLTNFIKVPQNLHRDYIKHALVDKPGKYKFWSFKDKGSKSVFRDPRAYSNDTFKEGGEKFSEKQKEIIKADLSEKLPSTSKKYTENTNYDKITENVFTNKGSGNEAGDRQTKADTVKDEVYSSSISKTKDSFENDRRLSTTATYYPFSETFKQFLEWHNANVIGFGEYNEQYANFLENIPTVTVRAYIPETILGLFVDMIGDVIGIFSKSDAESFGDRIKENLEKATKDTIESFEKLFRVLKTNNGYKALVKQMVSGLGIKGGETLNGNYDDMVINLPYVLYYKILKAQTNNIYEFPAIVNNIFKSNTYGWSNGHQFNLGSKQSGFLSLLANTIGTTISPVFDPRHNGADETAGFTITLDLINDTIEHAKQNYNLVQSLILYNMWVQYGLVQGPGSLYDVKIAGGQRFLMCTGSFSVTNKGMMRKIQGNASASNWYPWKDEIRVPDVYSLNLEFKSLLPNNLNNYMISICIGNNMTHPGSTESGSISKLMENTKNAINELDGKISQAVSVAVESTYKTETDSFLQTNNLSDSNFAKNAIQEVAADNSNEFSMDAEGNVEITSEQYNSFLEDHKDEIVQKTAELEADAKQNAEQTQGQSQTQ